ncbi:MAG: hypothetical protein Q9225_000566 [Loekoesia sp. 1 TL-2023]
MPATSASAFTSHSMPQGHEEEQDDESVGRHRRRREAQSIHGPVWAWLRQLPAVFPHEDRDTTMKMEDERMRMREANEMFSRSPTDSPGSFAPRATVSVPSLAGSDAEKEMYDEGLERSRAWNTIIVPALQMDRVQGGMRGQNNTQDRAGSSNAVNRALNAISYGGAAFNTPIPQGPELHNKDYSPPSPRRNSPDPPANHVYDSERPGNGTWTYVDEINARIMYAASRNRQEIRTADSRHTGHSGQCTMGSSTQFQSPQPWRPGTGATEVFPPPTSGTLVPDPAKPKVTAGGAQEANPAEAFPPPDPGTPVPDPIKSRATAEGSPFRPSHSIRRVGHLVDQKEMPAKGFTNGETSHHTHSQDLGGYEFVLEQAGLDR